MCFQQGGCVTECETQCDGRGTTSGKLTRHSVLSVAGSFKNCLCDIWWLLDFKGRCPLTRNHYEDNSPRIAFCDFQGLCTLYIPGRGGLFPGIAREICVSDAAFSLTVGSFLLTVELFYLQLCWELFYLQLELFSLLLELLYLQLELSCLQ